jgi:hypothetical protein
MDDQHFFGAQMLPSSTPRKTIRLKMPASHVSAEIEYRVVWNETGAHWEIYRNGARTGASRRKKQSAIDMAILAIKAEKRSPEAKAIVTSLKDRILKIEWSGPPNDVAAASGMKSEVSNSGA